jgi:hypothetical protein
MGSEILRHNSIFHEYKHVFRRTGSIACRTSKSVSLTLREEDRMWTKLYIFSDVALSSPLNVH